MVCNKTVSLLTVFVVVDTLTVLLLAAKTDTEEIENTVKITDINKLLNILVP